MGKPVRVEILEAVSQGAEGCTFAIHLPLGTNLQLLSGSTRSDSGQQEDNDSPDDEYIDQVQHDD